MGGSIKKRFQVCRCTSELRRQRPLEDARVRRAVSALKYHDATMVDISIGYDKPRANNEPAYQSRPLSRLQRRDARAGPGATGPGYMFHAAIGGRDFFRYLLPFPLRVGLGLGTELEQELMSGSGPRMGTSPWQSHPSSSLRVR